MSLVHYHDHKVNKLSRLRLALILTGAGMILEFIGGWISNSLALISDAGHMLTHLFALGMSYFAILLYVRPPTKKRTFGFYRAEVLAAFINGLVLIFIAFYIVYEALQRFMSPEEIRIQEMLLVALIGFVINGVTVFLLARVSVHDLNIRSALLHELGDIFSSVAVVSGGFFIFYTKNYLIDPILSFFICILIVIWAVKLLMESGHILLEATPKHLDIDEVVATIEREIPNVHHVHHVHAWVIASSMYALTAQVTIEDCRISETSILLDKINKLVKDKFHIEHTNIQFECLKGKK
jgi:cobalt-zinc-cadmium efflux system protein